MASIESTVWTIALGDRMNISAGAGSERFQSGANKYAAYLETPGGRLRSDLAFANLHDLLPQQAEQPLRALDLGCGTGATAVRLARLGIHVTAVDCSAAMLDIAQRAAHESGVAEKIVVKNGDAAQLATLFPARSFDLILCHNILEYVDDPGAVLCDAARALRGSSAIVSVLVRSQAGEVLNAAIRAGDLDEAENALMAEWGEESLYGGRVRLFGNDYLQRMLKAASLTLIVERGVRVIADYLPPAVSRDAEYQRILKLERKLGMRPEFSAVARYRHCLARRPDPVKEESK
jgi:S-adenosylmethionine-dependent methyltransferase